jgi:hypothetical protein
MTIYGTCYALHTMKVLVYKWPTIMGVPKAFEELNVALSMNNM